MARPLKRGLDYFPLDVVLDDKFGLIEAEFGLTGFAVVIKLFQKIYGQQGYYCNWTEEVALLFSRECGVGVSVVSEIVRACIRRNIFDRDMHDKHGILTSAGIQRRYLTGVNRRQTVEVEKDYLLIECDSKTVNVNNNPVNVDNNPENVSDNSQSKVKKSKEKKSKEDRVSPAANPSPKSNRFKKPTVQEISIYCQQRGNNINPQRFYDFYESKGWVVGKSSMKDWKAAVRTWEQRDRRSKPAGVQPGQANVYLDLLERGVFDDQN